MVKEISIIRHDCPKNSILKNIIRMIEIFLTLFTFCFFQSHICKHSQNPFPTTIENHFYLFNNLIGNFCKYIRILQTHFSCNVYLRLTWDVKFCYVTPSTNNAKENFCGAFEMRSAFDAQEMFFCRDFCSCKFPN